MCDAGRCLFRLSILCLDQLQRLTQLECLFRQWMRPVSRIVQTDSMRSVSVNFQLLCHTIHRLYSAKLCPCLTWVCSLSISCFHYFLDAFCLCWFVFLSPSKIVQTVLHRFFSWSRQQYSSTILTCSSFVCRTNFRLFSKFHK